MCETNEELSNIYRVPEQSLHLSATLKDLQWTLETKVTSKTPATEAKTYRYRDVWLRAFIKIKANASVTRLSKEIKLFGANTLREDRTSDATQADALVRRMMERTLSVMDTPVGSSSVIRPSSPFRLVWSSIYTLLMVYTALIMPFRMAFYEDSVNEWFILDNVVNALFFCDILLTLNTAFYNSEGSLVTSRKAIFLNYMRSWLFVDVVACVPFNAMDSQQATTSGSSNQVSAFLRLMRLPRLYRLLRLARVFTAIRRNSHSHLFERLQELVSLKHGSIRLVLFLFTVGLALHLMACLWYFIPTIEGMTPDTWVVARTLQDASATELYINSLYWAMTTLATVGYGDIVPTTLAEKIVAMIWMMFGVCFFSFVVSSLANMLNNVDTKRTLLAGKLAALDEFSDEANLTKDLRFRLRHALRYSTIHTGFSTQVKRGIFNELPRSLRFEVAMAMHHGAAKSIPFFADRDQAFVAAIVPFLNSLLVGDQDIVYTEGDYADEIYFIWQGCCSLMFNDLMMKKMQRGAYFGEVEVFLTTTRQNTVQAILRTELLSMNKKVLSIIQTDFPSVYEEMKDIAIVRSRLNGRAKDRFKALFTSQRKQPVYTRKAIVRRQSVFNEEPKTVKHTPDERLDEIEESVKDIRTIVASILETQRTLLQSLASQNSASLPGEVFTQDMRSTSL